MDNLVRIKDLNMYYPVQSDFMNPAKEYIRALNGINLDIRKGEILGLVGESGCGKSTLGKAVLKLIEPVGEVFFEDKNVLNLKGKSLKDFRKKSQMIFQNPYSSLDPRMTVYKILREPLVVHGIRNKKEIDSKILEIADLTGLNREDLKRYPHEFSGGQRQRIAIARALILKPEFLVADEPVSALDVSIQAQIITLLKDLKEKLNLTILFISHDLGVVKYLSDRIAVMYLGDIVELSDTEQLFKAPMHPYTQALISAVPTIQAAGENSEGNGGSKNFGCGDGQYFEKTISCNGLNASAGYNFPAGGRIKLKGDLPSPKNPPKACKFHTRCPFAKEICSQKEPQITQISDFHCVKCHFCK